MYVYVHMYVCTVHAYIRTYMHMYMYIWWNVMCLQVNRLEHFSSFRGTAVGVCLFSNTCFGLAFNFFAAHEGQGSGVTWTNAATPISNENALHLGIVFGMLLLDIVLFIVVAW